MAFLQVIDLIKDFGGVVANNHISFDIDQGEIIGLIGPNGAGKTTLFNYIVGYHKPDSGKVIFKDKEITGFKPFMTNREGPYLDMPLQHAHPDVLRRMRRPANVDWVYRTLEKMRLAMPDLALRTTFIVGYPGESEAEFQTLLDFVTEVQFDRVGAFQFSFEPGTTSEALGDPIPSEVKQERWERLMALQHGISLARNQACIGKTLDVLVEGQGNVVDPQGRVHPGEVITLGRSYRDAPEIDGLVIIEGDIPPGEMVPVRVTGALPYDLSGTVERQRLVVL